MACWLRVELASTIAILIHESALKTFNETFNDFFNNWVGNGYVAG
jgi:hypothetical protein